MIIKKGTFELHLYLNVKSLIHFFN